MNVTRQLFRSSLNFSSSRYAVSCFARYLCEDTKVLWTDKRLDETVKKNNIVIFMKGVPTQPMCGFSNAVVQILRMHGVQDFDSYNILDDQELRQRIKEYSNWPTIPQVYMGGEFIGGCDIFLQMHQNGELIDELLKIGFKSALLEKAMEDDKGKNDEK